MERQALTEMGFRPMDQHSKVAAIDLQVAADVVLVALVEEQPLEQELLALGKALQRGVDCLALLGSDQAEIRGRARRCLVVVLFERCCAGIGALHLEQHVVADAVDKGAEALRAGQPAFLLQRREHPHEGFLAGVLDLGRRAQPGAQLQHQQFSEVAGEMTLGVGVPGNQPADVLGVEVMALQSHSWSLSQGVVMVARDAGLGVFDK